MMMASEINQYGVSQGTFYNNLKKHPSLLTFTKFSIARRGSVVRDLTDFVEFYKKVNERDICSENG